MTNIQTSTRTYKLNGEYRTYVRVCFDVTFTKIEELQDILVSIEKEYGKGCFCSIDSQDWNNDWKEEYTIMLEWSKEPTTEDLKKLLDEQEYNIKMYTNSLKGLKDGDLFNEFTEKLCEAISIKEDIIKMLGGV